MVALASAAKFKEVEKEAAEQVKIISKRLEELNKLNWTMMDHLIDNQQTICVSGKVIVDGKEFSKSYISHLLKVFIEIDWEGFYQLLTKYRTDIMNQILRDGRKVNVADILIQIERMTKVNWADYYRSYGNYFIIEIIIIEI